MKLQDGQSFRPCEKPDGALRGLTWQPAWGLKVIHGDIRDMFQQGRFLYLRVVPSGTGKALWFQLAIPYGKAVAKPEQTYTVESFETKPAPRGNVEAVLTLHRKD